MANLIAGVIARTPFGNWLFGQFAKIITATASYGGRSPRDRK
ncbi:MAG TPA: hypothetical protein VJC18_02965 [bacterium]|nr:hypothetical protein [bacterium]